MREGGEKGKGELLLTTSVGERGENVKGCGRNSKEQGCKREEAG